MSITGKIRFGLGLLLAFIILQFVIGQVLDRATQTEVNTAVTKNFAAADKLAQISVEGQQIRRYEKEFFIYVNDEAGRAKYRKEWTGTFNALKTNLDTMQANKDGIFSATDLTAIAEWGNALEFYSKEFTAIMAKADAGNIVPAPVVEEPKIVAKGVIAPPAPPPPNLAAATKLANDMIGPGKDKFRSVLDGAEKLRKAKAIDSAANVTQITKLFSTATLVSIGVFVLALLIAAYLMMSIPASVKKPIAAFVAAADKISKGDVKTSLDLETAPEFSVLGEALERLRVAQSGMLDRLRNKAASPF
jgi:methyl-accepting chemotaxis protein